MFNNRLLMTAAESEVTMSTCPGDAIGLGHETGRGVWNWNVNHVATSSEPQLTEAVIRAPKRVVGTLFLYMNRRTTDGEMSD